MLILAKISSGWLFTSAATQADPVFPFLSRAVTSYIAISAESLAMFWIVRSRYQANSSTVLFYLGGLFALYRFGLWLLGIQVKCHCLGITDNILGLSEKSANAIAVSIIAYFTLPFLFLSWIGYARRSQIANE